MELLGLKLNYVELKFPSIDKILYDWLLARVCVNRCKAQS